MSWWQIVCGFLAVFVILAVIWEVALKKRLSYLTREHDVEGLVKMVSNTTLGIEAIKALGLVGDERAIEPLIASAAEFQGTDVYVQESLAQIWDRSADPQTILVLLLEQSWAGFDPMSQILLKKISDELEKIDDPQIIKSLTITVLKDPRKFWFVSKDLVQALGRTGDASVVDTLVAVLEKSGFILKNEAKEKALAKAIIEALGRTGDARAVEPLLVALQDVDQQVRREAAMALGKIGDARAVEPLVTALNIKDVNYELSITISEVLTQLGDVRGLENLISWTTKTNNTNAHELACKAYRGALVRILESSSLVRQAVPSQQLHIAAEIEDVKWSTEFIHPDRNCSHFDETFRHVIDNSRIRQLARQELIRRGEQA